MTTDAATSVPVRHAVADPTPAEADADRYEPELACDAPLEALGRTDTEWFGWEERDPFDENC